MQAYNERLSAPASWWLIALCSGVPGALIMAWFGPVGIVAGFVVAAAAVATLVARYGSVRVRVTATHLLAGKARIPVEVLGLSEALDAEAARRLRMEGADPRAFMVLRSYVPTAVRVQMQDPQDPTPYLYLSTRRPERLVEVLEAVRRHRSAPA